MNSKNRNLRDLSKRINEFKRGYQPRNNLVNDVNCDLLADFHNTFNSLKKHFSRLLNIHSVNDVSQKKYIQLNHPTPLWGGSVLTGLV
jgi:hypothetical protein